jgi:hypothetical protein
MILIRTIVNSSMCHAARPMCRKVLARRRRLVALMTMLWSAPASASRVAGRVSMLHWSAAEEQQSPAASEAPAAEPPPLAPIERAVEIFERFFLHEPELTAELLGELAPLRHLGPGIAVWLAVDADVPTLDTSTAELLPPAVPLLAEQGSTWSKPGAYDEWVPEEPKWTPAAIGSPHRIDRCFRATIHSEAGRIGAREVMRLS